MNRIGGVVNFDKSLVDPAMLESMARLLGYPRNLYGKFLVNETTGLLCISTGNNNGGGSNSSLPYQDQEFSIVFDGRIDNRPDLLSSLAVHLFHFPRPVSDEEIVLAAYRKWGLDFPKHLIGDFALAIWNKPDRQLVCVRDRFGVKPLYYSGTNNSFIFASTPETILGFGKIPPLINEARIADHLVEPLEGVDKTSSFYQDIFRLSPSHMLILQESKITIRRYWELQPTWPAGIQSEEDRISSFQGLLEEAVRCRLVKSNQTASMLSGGLDSSAIVSVARKILLSEGKNPFSVFAVVSNSTDLNRETAYINQVLGLDDLNPFLFSETSLFECMDALVSSIEEEAEPFDCLMNVSRLVNLNAKTHNISVMFDGVDGDTLLGDIGYLIQLWREFTWKSLIQETLLADGLVRQYGTGKRYLIDNFLSTLKLLAPDWLRKMRSWGRNRTKLDLVIQKSLLDRNFAYQSNLGERLARLEAYEPSPKTFKQLDFHKIGLDHPFLTVGLERYERVASAFGIEASHPLIDVRLVEFCLGLPWQSKTHNGWTKMILRQAVESFLPHEVVWRKDKDNLMWEFNRLILKKKAEYFHQATLDERDTLRPYVNIHKLENIWHAYLTDGDEKHSEMIWQGIALAFWLRRHRNMVRDLKLQQ